MTIWLAEGESVPTVADAERIAAQIRALRPDAEVWLFGSLARGRIRRGSDIDLAVVLPDAAFDGRRVIELSAELRRAAHPHDQSLDLVVFRQSWFDALADDGSALAATVRREGMRLA